MTTEHPLSGENVPPLPAGAASQDHPGWRFAFRVLDLGVGGSDSASWSPFVRITVWAVLALALIGAIIWIAGPWLGLGTGGLYGLMTAGKAVHRTITGKHATAEDPTVQN